MRILKELERAGIKITIFTWNNKISVKFERDLVEVNYKFRDGSGIDNLETAESFLDESFMEEVDQMLQSLSGLRFRRWQSWQQTHNPNQEIEVII